MKKDVLIRTIEVSSPDYGCYPGHRSIEDLLKSGFFLLDKPRGPTSNDITAQVKKILCLKKAGHAGTLDPNVSGVLPITLENACKIMPALQRLDKEYVGIMHLHKDVNVKKLKKIMGEFTGLVTQLPPLKSGVVRKERGRMVFDIKILDKKGKDVCFSISCEAGLYVRKIVHDIGKKIDGAHLKELRRVGVGLFSEDECHTIQELEDAYNKWRGEKNEKIRELVLPVESAIQHLKKVWIKDSAVNSICNGAPLATCGICIVSNKIEKGELIAIMTMKGELVALGVSNMKSKDMVKKRGLAIRTDRVIMKKGTYPNYRR